MKTISTIKVAIIGGGIGGAAAAIALHKQGIEVDVYEQAPIQREVGAGIGLRPPTIRYFKDWGIYDQIAKKSSESLYMEIIAGNGPVLIKEKWPVLTDNPEEQWARLIHRADLLDIFIAQLPKEKVHLSHRCHSIVENENYVEVLFENGHKIQADLVIAADGIRSIVRSKIFGDIQPVYSGFHAYRTIVDEDATIGMVSEENILRIYVDGQIQVYLLPLQHRKQVSVDITAPSSDASWRPKVTKDEILSHITNYHPNIQKLIESIPLDAFTCRPLYDIDTLDGWSSKRVTLVGDSAHAMLHNQGQGANMAIQDGGALAVALAESTTIEEALSKYEAHRKPITKTYQELSRLFPSQEAKTAFPEKEYF
ncbi:NAD(P)/FAD-dependent oxidoreductase [Cytobacillus kochii]|uniref:FAD-dependent oxidoreductase n=1 Tax=Cytobacillus kochii TaxID=859143 RepID=UPI002E1B4C93|nr:NAD(P)/FAD-dependent oxidoreductase [Cytobacillus kochii]